MDHMGKQLNEKLFLRELAHPGASLEFQMQIEVDPQTYIC